MAGSLGAGAHARACAYEAVALDASGYRSSPEHRARAPISQSRTEPQARHGDPLPVSVRSDLYGDSPMSGQHTSAAASYLAAGLPRPVPEPDGLDRPYWEGTRAGRLLVQRCRGCGTFQWGPEWICHRCLAPDPDWVEVAPRGRIYSWERAWHPVHPALRD